MADELKRGLPERYIVIQIVWSDQEPQSYLIPIALDSESWDEALARVFDQVRVQIYRLQMRYWRQALEEKS